jgi:hypothetical protein
MTTLLVMTVGQTDVQLASDGERREFKKGQVGSLHDQLRTEPEKWKLVDAPCERREEVSELLPENTPWEICTPKLDAVLAYFRDAPPSSVLLLETTRNNKDDPRFAGSVLQMRARSKGIEDVRCCAYLGPKDRSLEDRDCPLDAIIQRDVVKRVENAIRDSVKGATRVVVATTGGMPEVKALVKELVRLHTPANVELDEVEVDDGSRDGSQPDKAVSRRRVDPVEQIRLRKQSLSLIEKGNLIGAWGAVQHVDAQGHPWTLVNKWLYDFASSLPLPPDCDLPFIGHDCMAVRTALRVEFALRANDVPRAIHGTVAFLESALWDHLQERIVKHPTRKHLFKFKDPIDEGLVRNPDLECEQESKSQRDKYRKRPFIYKSDSDGDKWYRFENQEGCDRQLAKAYLKLEGIVRLSEAITADIRELRNNVAHADPAPEQVKEAVTRMRSASLWSDHDTFLSQRLVRDVLAELGVSEPSSLCDRLLDDVRVRLLDPSV